MFSSWIRDEEKEEEEEGEEEDKQSVLKLFLMAKEEEEEGEFEEEASRWTPKSLIRPLPTKFVVEALKFVQVLELWPMFPQCEHFLPIFHQDKGWSFLLLNSNNDETQKKKSKSREREREKERERAQKQVIYWCGLYDDGGEVGLEKMDA